MGLHQIKKLLYSKGNNQQSEKAAYGMKGKICKPYMWKGVNSQNISETATTAKKKKKSVLFFFFNLSSYFSKDV